jgi:hypothetical protein
MSSRWKRHCSDANRVTAGNFNVEDQEGVWMPQLVDTVLAACDARSSAVLLIIDQAKDDKTASTRESELIKLFNCYEGVGAARGLNMKV